MIKFRAWDNRYKEYIKNVMIDMCGKVYFDDGVATQDDLDIHVEQFTGLKDVNGKDIYEGDILENRKYRSIVKFASGKFLADVVGTINKFDLIGETHGSKVIGNVHANPELLEE